jgi:hypothetical protein
MRARFVFSTNSRLSVRASHDCDKHEKRQVGGFLCGETMKQCKECRQWKDVTEFVKDNRRPSGYGSPCKECSKKRSQKYYAENPRKVAESNKKWKLRHLEKVKEMAANWRESNREKIQKNNRLRYANNIEKERERERVKRENNREQLRERSREWANAHPDRRRVATEKYRALHPEKDRERKSNWYFRNKENETERIKQWRERNPGKGREWKQARRARLVGAGGKISASEWSELCNKYKNRCLCCGRGGVKLALDHIVPLSAGGTNTIDNAQPLCKSCNSKKGRRTIDYRPDGLKCEVRE